MSNSPACCAPLYGPRRPESTALYRLLQEHLETFIERTETAGRELPDFVKAELRSFLICGIHAYGFARSRCSISGESLERLCIGVQRRWKDRAHQHLAGAIPLPESLAERYDLL